MYSVVRTNNYGEWRDIKKELNISGISTNISGLNHPEIIYGDKYTLVISKIDLFPDYILNNIVMSTFNAYKQTFVWLGNGHEK